MIGKLVIVLLTALAASVWADRINYCDKSLCKDAGYGVTHVACSSNSGFDSFACGSQVKEIPLDGVLQDLILDLHNTARNTVAQGGLNKYGGSDRMIEMTYDKDLEFVASFNSRKCKFGHDQCRNTFNFPYSGQNIAITSSSPTCLDTKASIIDMFNRWFNEYQSCGLSSIKSFSLGGAEIGHFTQIANNKASKVGCSLVQWIQYGTCNTYLVCNYALTNMLNQPIFTTGKAGSKCQTGVSSKYPGLCSTAESLLLKPVPYGVTGGLPNAQSTTVIGNSNTGTFPTGNAPVVTSNTYTSGGFGNAAPTVVTTGGVTKTTYTFGGNAPVTTFTSTTGFGNAPTVITNGAITTTTYNSGPVTSTFTSTGAFGSPAQTSTYNPFGMSGSFGF